MTAATTWRTTLTLRTGDEQDHGGQYHGKGDRLDDGHAGSPKAGSGSEILRAAG